MQIEAAAALGTTASAGTAFAGLHHLMAFYRDKCCEPGGAVSVPTAEGVLEPGASFVQKAYGPTDIASYLVLQV